MKYTDEELNYFRVCKVTTNIITDGLRTVFKQEWDNHYKATYGQWQDTAQNAIHFIKLELPKTQKKNARLLAIMKNGNTKEWDCTCLFYAILYSDGIGPFLNTTVKKSVDELREFRNKVFAHTRDGKLTEADFKTAIRNVTSAFTALKLDTALIEKIKNQTSFPTEELEEMKRQLEKERKRNEESRPFCVLPPKPSHNTINRLNEVGEIRKEMERLRNTKKNEVTVVYLSGNPGCGKSEVARQVGEQFFDEKGTGNISVMTLNASSIDTLVQSYVELAGRIRCDEDSITRITTSKDLSKEEKLNSLRSLISPRLQGYSSWLIIVDNVLDLKTFSKYWPQAGERTNGVGQILVTTQDSSSIPSNPAYTHHLPLKKGMNEDDAISTLSEVSGFSSDKDPLLEVAKALDFQPLALACAAVYMQYAQLGTDWTKYLQKLKEGKLEATEAMYKKTSSAYLATMTEAVRMAVEKVAQQNQVMMHAFQFLSVVAPQPISLSYVVQYVTKCLPDKDREDVAASICSSSLVLSSEGDEPKEIRVHQVIYNSLHTSVFETDQDITLDVVSAFVSLTSEDGLDEIERMIVNRRLVVHFSNISTKVRHILEHNPNPLTISPNKNHLYVITSSLIIGKICSYHARYEVCRIFFEMSLKLQENIFYNKCLTTAESLNSFGNSLKKLGLNQEAKKWFERKDVLDNRRKEEDAIFGVDNTKSVASQEAIAVDENEEPSEIFFGGYSLSIQDLLISLLAYTQHALAKLFWDKGQYEKTDMYLKKAEAVLECKFKENYPNLEYALNYAGANLCKMGKYDDAKKCLVKAKKIQDEAHDEMPLELAVATLNNLGHNSREMGNFIESKEYLDKALDIQEKASLETQQNYADTLKNLANTCIETGQLDLVKKSFEKALSIEENLYDKKDPKLVGTLNELGDVLRLMGRYEDAEKYLKRALSIQEVPFRTAHPNPAITLKALGDVFCDEGHNEDAIKCFQDALAIQEKAYNSTHPEVAVTLTKLGDTLRDMGQYDKAREYLEKSLNIKKLAYGERNPDMVDALEKLGDLFSELGEYEEAQKHLERALDIQEKAFGQNHPHLADTLNNLGDLYREMGDFERAKLTLERALNIQTKAYGKNHQKLAGTLNNLSDLSFDMDDFKEAQKYLETALKIQEKAFGYMHLNLIDTLDNFFDLFFKLDKFEDATKTLETALKIKENAFGDVHLNLIDTLDNFFDLFFELDKFEEAVKTLERILKIQKKTYGERHPELLDTLNALIETTDKMGQPEEALNYRQMVQEIEAIKDSNASLNAENEPDGIEREVTRRSVKREIDAEESEYIESQPKVAKTSN